MAVTFADQVCIDPAALAAECERVGIPLGAWYGSANRYACPLGVDPGVGDLLLTKRQLDNIALDQGHDLEFKDTISGQSATFTNIHLIAQQCVTPGKPDDPNAVYHVQVSDVRHLWRLCVLDQGYNHPQTPGDDAISEDTINDTAAWTWEEVWGSLWATLSPLEEGDAPELPEAPQGTPNRLDYFGLQAPDGMRDFLRRLGFDLAYDPTTATCTVVILGDTQPNLEVALDALTPYRLHDAQPSQPIYGSKPEKVRVLFPKRPEEAYGGDPWFSIDVEDTSGDTTGVIEGTVVTLRDDHPALMAATNCTNQGDLDTRATARAEEYFRQVQGDGLYQSVFAGVHTSVLPGSEITTVIWEERGAGLKTEVVRQALGRRSMTQWVQNPNDERWRLVDHAWVYLSESGVTPPTGYYPCNTEHYDVSVNAWFQLFPCWFREMNGQTPVAGRYLVRFAGQKANGSGDSRPVYIGGCCADGTGDGPGGPSTPTVDTPTDPPPSTLTCLTELPSTLNITLSAGTDDGTPGVASCTCLHDTVVATQQVDGMMLPLPNWTASGFGACNNTANAEVACTDNGNGTHTIQVDINCGATNVGTGTALVVSGDLATLDVTLVITMTDPTWALGCGTCRYQWFTMTSAWVLVSNDCGLGYCACPDEVSLPPGSMDLEYQDFDCDQTATPCCLGTITVRVTA